MSGLIRLCLNLLIIAGYDMKYVSAYIVNYCYGTDLKKIIGIEWEYDTLSVVKPGQSLVAWAVSVRIRLQELLAYQRFSVYHRHCLFAGFGNGKMVNSDYHRPRINKSNMAICFDCWKLVKITDIKPKKIYFNGWRRYGYEIKSEDLMKYHWDNECSKTKTKDGGARLIQNAYRNYKSRPKTLAKRVWEAVRNDNTPEDKKFLNMPNSDYRYSMEFGIFVKEGFHSRHAVLYDAKSWSDHKRRQLANRLSWQELAEKKLQQELAERQKYVLLNIQRRKGFHQIVNNDRKMHSLYLPQIDRSKEGNTNEIFISSLFAKQNNLLSSINYLNQPALRLKDGTKITFV
jgi:hypothetical protein